MKSLKTKKLIVAAVLAAGMSIIKQTKAASDEVTAQIRVTIATAIELKIRTIEQNGTVLNPADDWGDTTFSASSNVNDGNSNRAVITPRTAYTIKDEVRIFSNSVGGFRLDAKDGQAGNVALTRVGGGASIPDWTGTLAAPTTMDVTGSSTDYGFGITVLSVTNDTVPTKWSSGTKYAGLPQNYSTQTGDVLYSRTTYDSTGNGVTTVTVGYGLNVDVTQMAGNYDGTVSYQGTTL